MDVVGRRTAAMLLALFVGLAACPAAHAAPAARSACARGDAYSRGCVSTDRWYHANRGSGTFAAPATAFGRAWARRHPLYHGEEAAISQLSPRLRAQRAFTLRFDEGAGDLCGQRGGRKACTPERNLADALLRPPNPATEGILRENGIPIVPDVAPIVILRSGGRRANPHSSPHRP